MKNTDNIKTEVDNKLSQRAFVLWTLLKDLPFFTLLLHKQRAPQKSKTCSICLTQFKQVNKRCPQFVAAARSQSNWPFYSIIESHIWLVKGRQQSKWFNLCKLNVMWRINHWMLLIECCWLTNYPKTNKQVLIIISSWLQSNKLSCLSIAL
jgi:hypothetical protein